MRSKKRVFISIGLVLALALTACGVNQPTTSTTYDETDNEIRAFSYDGHREMYVGDAGFHDDGFHNIERNPITSQDDAIALARNEVRVDYTAVSVFYDNESEMWMVHFFVEHDEMGDPVAGGGQSVYLNREGITTMIVFGE